MTNENKKTGFKTFGQLCAMCGCSRSYLKDFIKIHEDLSIIFKPYFDNKKNLYPPAVYNVLLNKMNG